MKVINELMHTALPDEKKQLDELTKVLLDMKPLQKKIQTEIEELRKVNSDARKKRNLCIMLCVIGCIVLAASIACPFIIPFVAGGATVAAEATAVAMSAGAIAACAVAAVTAATAITVSAVCLSGLEAMQVAVSESELLLIDMSNRLKELDAPWTHFKDEIERFDTQMSYVHEQNKQTSVETKFATIEDILSQYEELEKMNNSLINECDVVIKQCTKDLDNFKDKLYKVVHLLRDAHKTAL